MKLIALAILAVIAAASAQSDNWPHLRTTFGSPSDHTFNAQPRTVDEALAAVWIQLSACGDVPK